MLNSSGAADLHSSAGGGVSGLSGDIALNLSSVNAMSGSASTTGGVLSVTNPTLGGLVSFTITGWFKADEVISGAARIVDYNSGSNGILLCAAGPLGESGTFQLAINGNKAYSTNSAYSAVGAWTFFAVTYDGSVANFYVGTTSATASLVNSASASYGTIIAPAAATTLCVGNRSAYDRTFDGYFDNIELYGSSSGTSGALALSEIQAIQASAIPESGSVLSMFLGVILLAFAWSQRIKNYFSKIAQHCL